MENVIKFCVNHKRSVLTMLVFILICGIYSYFTIPKESNPSIKIPLIYVRVEQTGISPEDAERMLVRPLEKNLRSISGVKEITSYASEGNGVVLLEFIAGFDSKIALQDVRAKVNDTQRDLPSAAETPSISEVDLSLIPMLNVILSGDIPERSLYKIAKDMKSILEGIPDVLSVQAVGHRSEVVEIVLEPKILERYKLFLPQITNIIGGNNALIPAGSIRNNDGEFMLKVPALIKNPEILYDFPIHFDGNKVTKLRDVAIIKNKYKDPQTIARVNGQKAVVLEITKRTGANVLNVVTEVKKLIADNKDLFPNKLNITYSQDQSSHIHEMIDELENGIILAGLLVVVIVILTIGTKPALLISLSLPICFFACVLVLHLCGYSMNTIVLFSLILTVGMVVDDAIVVSEYAERKMIEGMKAADSFIAAATRMFLPIVSATLVKVVVFLPLLFWPGVLGQFMRYMPITVTVIMGSSLIFAICFQPAIGALLMKNGHKADPKILKATLAAENGDIDNLDPITKWYGKTLAKILQKPKTFSLCTIAFIGSVYVFFIVFGTGTEFFPKVDPENGIIIIKAPGNLSIEEKNNIMLEIEKRIEGMEKEIKVIYTTIRKGGNSGQMDDTIGNIQLEFTNWQNRRKADAIMNDIKQRVADIRGAQIQTILPRPGPNAAKPISINVTGYDLKEIGQFTDKIIAMMNKMPGLYDVEDSRNSPAIEWHIDVDRELAARYGLNINQVSNAILTATEGLKVSSYTPDDGENTIDIVLRLPSKYRYLSKIMNMRIANDKGALISLSNIATIKPKVSVSQIMKVNRQKVVQIEANVSSGFLVNDKVKEIKAWLAENPQQTVKAVFKGDDENQRETAEFLPKAFATALFAMFVIMLLQFNSFYYAGVVMSAVFLSTVGVLLGLLISWQPFGIVMCGIGVIALAGIVLNNNILFVDTYKHLRAQGHSQYDAALITGIQRMRPILLTASTAVLGLIPMVIGCTINFMERAILYDAPSSQWWRQLSASIAGGLTFATVLTLFFTPCLLLLRKEKISVLESNDSNDNMANNITHKQLKNAA